MVRDLRRLADTRFDLIVVGAGFYGALAAWDATLRGLSVALIDQGDFGAATSFNNLKTLHGGLRSLQTLNVTEMRLFIRERRALARVAPHLVQPLPFIVPTYRRPARSAALMRLALTINDAVSHDRHAGLADPSLRLPAGALLTREECLARNPTIDPEGVTGGALWYDYQMHSTDRMTLAFVLSAAARDAAVANYVRAVGIIRDGGRVAGVRVEDRLTSSTFDLRGRTVLNAAGPWASSFLEASGVPVKAPASRLSRAMNLVTRRVTADAACGGLARGRFLFLIPWRDVSMLGTSHDAHHNGPDALRVSPRDVEAFLADAREAFPGARLTPGDVRLVHRGLLPMVAGDGTEVQLLRESVVVDHRRDGAAGLISMFGVRYTTARDTAARAVDVVFRDRGVASPPPSRSAETPVLGGAIDDKERFLTRASPGSLVDPPTWRRLAMTYGTVAERVVPRLADAELARPLGPGCEITGAELVHAVRAEAAMTLSDALIRRTGAGSAGHPGIEVVARAAAIMAVERDWPPARVDEEVSAVNEFYRLPGV